VNDAVAMGDGNDEEINERLLNDEIYAQRYANMAGEED